MPSDRLKAFEFKSAFLYKSSQAQIALINANKEISLNKWNVALNTITLINTKNLPYPIFGIGRNSNSVTSTLIRCMDLHEPKIPSGGIAPFSGEMLLSEFRNRKTLERVDLKVKTGKRKLRTQTVQVPLRS
ncbi:hypothetical protein [Xylella fastidiosa]|uniref:Uncharacterized protein n=1 Tax=Xylella fastidiosa (strain 9a5c) TaxID=160492 RepID=Q9PC12_XYLFA|nr:hypothetical protein [Xylella fastidiosa]AAF84775.1 hypothetical protein XF_1973 [Xylella fastidiosa 9a5c]MDG5824154.1 hypothetical protein [Xylella fastidiosa subsp. pauca]MDG5824568.1 hypothetical protein [Xylella fastidiosa subsp. pauca]WGZ32884.1 hypothetical protein O4444_04590 [Xylella fastidiosa subsp. pauca]WGZ33313.1 hypothetical protein O4445_06380 [Xylella fastidiosa subsp. pauca]